MRKVLFAAIALAGAAFAIPAMAAPMPMSAPALERASDDGMIQQVRHWRGHRHGMRHHGWNRGHHYGMRHHRRMHRM